MRRSFLLYSAAARALCFMAQEGAEEAGTGNAPAPADQPLSGNLTRVTPDGNAEEQAAREYKAATGNEPPAPAEKVPGAEDDLAETPEAKAAREAQEAADKKEGGYDFKGTPFEGMTPEFQTAVTPFVEAFDKAGTLTDDEVKAAAEATKFPEPMIRQWMEGVQAQAARSSEATALNNAPVFDAVGGPDNFTEFQKWTTEKGNVSAAEERAINSLLKSDPEAAAVAMAPIVERWKATGAGGSATDLAGKGSEGGGAGGSEGVEAYANWAQVEKDMATRDYKTDAAFRAKVEARLAVSNF